MPYWHECNGAILDVISDTRVSFYHVKMSAVMQACDVADLVDSEDKRRQQ